MKKILSLAIAAALVAPVAAMAEATVYGKAHMVIQNTSEDDGTDEVDVWSVDSIDSRVGVKGSEDLGGGLKAVYKFEFKVNLDDGSGLGDRNQYVGLAGGFGTLLLGRHDTPLKMSQGKFDQFGDVAGDIKSVIPGEDRVDNVIAYVSPSMDGLSFVGALVAGELGDGGELDASSARQGGRRTGLRRLAGVRRRAGRDRRLPGPGADTLLSDALRRLETRPARNPHGGSTDTPWLPKRGSCRLPP